MRGETVSDIRGFLRDPVVMAVALVNAAVAAMYLFPILDPEQTTYILESWSMVPIASLGAVAPWVGLSPLDRPQERAFWGLWTLAFLLILSVRLVYLWSPGVDSVASGAAGIDLLYALFYLSLVLSLLVRPDRPRYELEGRRLRILEAGGTGIFVLALFAYFVLVPQAFARNDYMTWVPSLLMYLVLDLFLLITLLYLRRTSPSSDWKILYAWLALAPACWVVTEVLEILANLGNESEVWSSPLWNIFWYIPWASATLAARMRTAPVPGFVGGRAVDPGQMALRRSLGRPGWLVVAAMILPVIHIAANLFGFLDPASRNARDVVVLASLALLLGLAFLHQKLLEARAEALAAKSAALEDHRSLLAAAVEQAPEAILIADARGIVRYGNPAFEGMGGVLDWVLGASLEDALPSPLEGATETSLHGALREGLAWEGRHRFRTADGREHEDLVVVAPVTDSEEAVTHWVVVIRDVTYLTQLERQFRQSQKMEALGTLAGGIAHDFNNILGAIYGYAELLSLELGEGSQARRDLEGLTAAAERAAGLVSQILTFSRQGEEEPVSLRLEDVVRDALSLLRATLPATVEIREDIHPGSGTILGVRNQIHQVILNLGTNAAHAMGESGGTMEVGLRMLELDEEAAQARGLSAPGPCCLLTVRDFGEGMEKAVLDRIFDPFFTTKEVGKGTGLGLSVVHGAVTSHSGVITVQSEPGKGSLFEILLPCDGREDEAEEGQVGLPPDGAGERIMVVDDEPTLVALTEQMLQGLGYTVVSFTDSEEALALFLEDGTQLRLLISDQTMPKLTGLELARRVTEHRPGTPVLLTTGYSEVLSPERLVGAGVHRVLMKPFTRVDLGWAVAELLALAGGVPTS